MYPRNTNTIFCLVVDIVLVMPPAGTVARRCLHGPTLYAFGTKHNL